MKQISPYICYWWMKTEYFIKHKYSGTATAWILEGRFVQQTESEASWPAENLMGGRLADIFSIHCKPWAASEWQELSGANDTCGISSAVTWHFSTECCFCHHCKVLNIILAYLRTERKKPQNKTALAVLSRDLKGVRIWKHIMRRRF